MLLHQFSGTSSILTTGQESLPSLTDSCLISVLERSNQLQHLAEAVALLLLLWISCTTAVVPLTSTLVEDIVAEGWMGRPGKNATSSVIKKNVLNFSV